VSADLDRHDLAVDRPIEQVTQRRKPLLYRGRGEIERGAILHFQPGSVSQIGRDCQNGAATPCH
jgi:hypothetical protein